MNNCRDCVQFEDGFCKAGELNGDKHKVVDYKTAEICRLYKPKNLSLSTLED